MNARPASLLLVVLTAALASLAAAASNPKGVNASPILAGPPEAMYGRGTPRGQVLKVLGEPSARLGANVWVYFHFRADDPTVDPKLDTLVLAFERDKVIGLRLSDDATMRRIVAQRAPKLAGPVVAAAPAKR